jgi:hypothetical protein
MVGTASASIAIRKKAFVVCLLSGKTLSGGLARALRLGLSPEFGLKAGSFEQHPFFVTAGVDGPPVFIGCAMFEDGIFSADPAEFCTSWSREHTERLAYVKLALKGLIKIYQKMVPETTPIRVNGMAQF